MSVATVAGDLVHDDGPAAFGWTMPVLAVRWTPASGAALTEPGPFTLSLAGGTWSAPVPGTLLPVATAAVTHGVHLVLADGLVASDGGVLTLTPAAWLRLARLYRSVVEPSGVAAARAVPRHFRFADWSGPATLVAAGDELGVGGLMTVHDAVGCPVDPVSVAAAFAAILAAHPPYRSDDDPAGPSTGAALPDVLALATGGPARVRLMAPGGEPVADASALTGLVPLDTASGLYALAAGATAVGKAALPGSPDPGDVEIRRVLRLGLWPTGTLAESVALPPGVGAGVALARDTVTLQVVQLDRHLLGEPDVSGGADAPPPAVRLDENLSLLADGNDVAGAGGASAGGSPTFSLAVAPSISSGYAVPSAPGPGAHWPQFPPAAGASPGGPVPRSLRNDLRPVARWLAAPGPDSVDVVLTLEGLPAFASVRAYPRAFDDRDASVTRGDGGGGVADATGSAVLHLRDPFGLRTPTALSPTRATGAMLHVDLVVVRRTPEQESRSLGDLALPVTAETDPPPAPSNPFEQATRRGTSRAGILALGGERPADLPDSAVHWALTLASEGAPRDAPRLPTMARRDLLVAGRGSDGTWRAVVAGGRLAAELLSAQPRRGNPGSSGGRETQHAGVATERGALAYDVARAALRRTTNLLARVADLSGATWDEPGVGTTGAGFAAALLHTVAPRCETPELALLRGTLGYGDLSGLTWDALMAKVRDAIDDLVSGLPSSTPEPIGKGLRALREKVEEWRRDPPAEASRAQRVADELRRELAAAQFGRRDAQWALQSAFASARRFVYVESPGVTPAGDSSDPWSVDVWQTLAMRMQANPALHVAVCVPARPEVGPGYEPFALRELHERWDLLTGLPTWHDDDPEQSRIVVFSPVGYPGRRSALETTSVVVDDVWALVGSSTLRRRGLSFDGGTDVALVDQRSVDGASPAIREFRRSLTAARLGVTPPPAGPPLAGWAQLADGVEAFHAIRRQLRAGGFGRIEPLAPPSPGAATAPPTSLTDPGGEAFDPVASALFSWWASASTAGA